MKVESCSIPDVKLVINNIFTDDRGKFIESYKKKVYNANDITSTFVQDNLVYSKQNVLRGLHYQKENDSQGKLISCIKGKIFDVAVDLRKGSNTYKQWVGYFLSEEDNKFIYIPAGFAHGYSVESEDALVSYKCTKNYNPQNEVGIIWNDTDINIDWPKEKYIISNKDKKNFKFKELNL